MIEQSSFKFLGYRVPELSIEIKEAAILDAGVKNNLSVNVQNNFIKENNRFVEVVLTVIIVNTNDFFKIRGVIKGGFLADEKMPEDMFKGMYSINAPSILFPYIRSIISSVTAQCGIQQVILPLMNFTNPPTAENITVDTSTPPNSSVLP